MQVVQWFGIIVSTGVRAIYLCVGCLVLGFVSCQALCKKELGLAFDVFPLLHTLSLQGAVSEVLQSSLGPGEPWCSITPQSTGLRTVRFWPDFCGSSGSAEVI